MASIARNLGLGIELHENALNKISASLYSERPNLFETTEDIVVEPASGRILSLYAFLSQPFAFNLFPIQNGDFKEGSLYTEAALIFTLTDKRNSTDPGRLITRIKMTLQAGLRIEPVLSVSEQKIKVFLEKIVFTKFTSDHPTLAARSYENARSLVNASDTLPSKDPSFVALLNYIIEVFLLRSLKKPLETFPFPPLPLIIEKNVALYLRNGNIWGNVLGVYLDLASGPSVPLGGTPAHNKELTIGITEKVITAILDGYLPAKLPIKPTSDSHTFSIRENSWLELKRNTGPFQSRIDLSPPDRVKATIFFNAHINGRVNVKLGKYWVRTNLPIPIGDPSFIHGSFIPFIKEEDNKFLVKMTPARNFFTDPGAIVIVTNYRNLIRQAVKRWLDDHVQPILRKVPLIGWIVSKAVSVIVGELLSYFLGALLDGIVSTFLTNLLTVLFNVAKQIFGDKIEFDVYKIHKKIPDLAIPIALRSISNPLVDPNQGGELIISASFSDPPIPIPHPPVPEIPTAFFQTSEPDAGQVHTPEDKSFLPALQLTVPAWQDGMRLTYETEVTFGSTTKKVIQNIWFTYRNRTIATMLVSTASGIPGKEDSAEIVLDLVSRKILSEKQQNWVEDGDQLLEMISTITYDHDTEIAKYELQYGELTMPTTEIKLETTSLVGSVHGIFQLMGQTQGTGKVGRMDLSDDETQTVELIPVDVSVSPAFTAKINGKEQEVVKTVVKDRDFEAEAIFSSVAPFNLLSLAQTADGITVKMKLIPDTRDTV